MTTMFGVTIYVQRDRQAVLVDKILLRPYRTSPSTANYHLGHILTASLNLSVAVAAIFTFYRICLLPSRKRVNASADTPSVLLLYVQIYDVLRP